jgi:hypothetical protein
MIHWNTFAGGTSAHHGSSYGSKGEYGDYTIDPPQRRGGSYHLMWANTTNREAPHGGLWHDLGHYRSPQAAKKAAKEHEVTTRNKQTMHARTR